MFNPVPMGGYRQVALAIENELTPLGAATSNPVEIEIRGVFASSLSVPCSLFSAVQGGTTWSSGCPFPGASNFFMVPSNNPIAVSTLSIDAATGRARASFRGVPPSLGQQPRYLVFTVTPDMAIFMDRPPTAGPNSCVAVPAVRPITGGPWEPLRASSGGCNAWGCSNVYYDMIVSNGVSTGGTLQTVPGVPQLSAVGNAIPGRTYSAVVSGPAQAANDSVAALIFDLNSAAVGPCGSIFSPSTSWIGSVSVVGTLGGSVAADTRVPLLPAFLGGTYFQQGVVLHSAGGQLQVTPTAQLLEVTVGW
jgi:hypothetical protein